MKLKRIDLVIILISIIGILLSFAFVFYSKKSGKKYLVVYVGNSKRVYPLENGVFSVENNGIKLQIKISDGRVKVIHSTCPDKLCVKSGWINKQGQSIVCLPSRIFITIEGKQEKEEDVDVITR